MHRNTIVNIASHHCTVSRTFNVLLDSPVYTPSQSLQGTWYTTPFFLSSDTCDFTRINTCFKVLAVVKTLRMLRGAHILLNLSLSPRTYGVYRVPHGLVSSRSSVCGCFGKAVSIFFTMWAGKSFAWKTSSRCCNSFGSEEE